MVLTIGVFTDKIESVLQKTPIKTQDYKQITEKNQKLINSGKGKKCKTEIQKPKYLFNRDF